MIPILLLVSCSLNPTPAGPTPDEAPVAREAFNQTAIELGLPLFQRASGEIVTYRTGLVWDGDVEAGTQAVRAAARTERTLDARHQALRTELAAGRVTLIETPASAIPESHRAMVTEILAAGDQVEALFHQQTGVIAAQAALPADDALARAVFQRNQGPWCTSPAQADNPECRALEEATPRLSGIYPADVQQGDDWCAGLDRAVMDPFHVAVATDDGVTAVPYATHWATELGALAQTLDRAAAAAPEEEAALAAYLRAVATAARTNDWFAADVAWAAMNQDNSRWYLRIGPDETYWDPCSEHAGFHMSFAQVSREGLKYQQLLSPLKQQLEHRIAERAGAPYVERTVGFDLPEFIDIVANTGDSRSPMGATIGQSLPNWGPVSESGGRTVAMTNIGTDPDSVASEERTLGSLFCTQTLTAWPRGPEPLLFSTILHEAAHNLGPAQEYRVDGKTDSELFGGPLASMLEELKAQSAAMDLTIWLAHEGHIESEMVFDEQVADIAWALGHIGAGMSDGAGSPLAYSHLSAIQLGTLLDEGAIAWRADDKAANGADIGCFELDPQELPDAIEALAQEVYRIKATGDRAAAEALRDRFVSDGTPFAALRGTIEERMRREPQNSYVYRVE